MAKQSLYEIFNLVDESETLQFSLDPKELNIQEIRQSDLMAQEERIDETDVERFQVKNQIFNVRKLKLQFRQEESYLFIFNDVTDS